MAKRQSRQDRWNEAINLIEEGLSLLNDWQIY